MKRTLNFFKIIGTSAIVAFSIILLTKNNHFSCSALDAFSSNSSFIIIFKAIHLLAIAIGIWIAGLIVFLFIRKKKEINIYLYFTLITTLSLSQLIWFAIGRIPEENRQLKEQICEKSSDDGMQLRFRKLTKDEYDFINSETKWLPEVPNQTKQINIDYFRDDFLGDFDLKIELELIENKSVDSLNFPNWTKRNGKYYYEDFQI